LKNTNGITDSTIDIATVADVSGAVPNTFKSVFDAMNAYVAYFNATSSICGRKLKLHTIDSGLTANGSNSASKAACSSFAAVGSFSAFDGGGANVTAACGQPDIRASAVERSRQQSPTTFVAMPINSDHVALQPWVWAKQKFGAAAIQDSAFVYLNAGASKAMVASYMKDTAARLGYSWKKVIVVDIAGVPNWNGYANQLKAAGIKFVTVSLADFTPKLAAAFKQADFHPAFLSDAGVYGQKYLSGSDGAALNGAYVWTQTAMIEEAGRVPEMALYQDWLKRTGGDAPTYTGAWAWAAGVLFTKLAVELGGKLSRASMVQAAARVRNFKGNGIISMTDPGARTSGPCFTIMQVDSGRFTRVTPFPYTCGPVG
jgi:ABC-type branched-subunit amino acid transport system substrate-binding protein